MVATITTNKIFSGKIYAKENPNSCVVDVKVNIRTAKSKTRPKDLIFLQRGVGRGASTVYKRQQKSIGIVLP